MQTKKKGMGFLEVTAIGVGGMVGGGIFAVLGLAVQLAKGGAPLAFAIAGLIALASAYSYARLSVTFPSQGGTVAYLDRAFGAGLFTGTLNLLLWLSYIVMVSLYAHAFGSYAATFFPASQQAFWMHLLISIVVVAITGVNLLSADLIGKAEDWVVGIKLAILLLFVAIGSQGIDPAHLSPQAWSGPIDLIAGGMIIFLAYEGFELIANAAEDVRTPARTLPKAFFTSVGFVLLLYVGIAAVAVGNLPVDRIVAAKDYALAVAAKPFLGQAGFLMITLAAMLSTASAINATLYGAARLSYVIAKDGELPAVLEKKIWNEPLEGLLITAGGTLLLANLFDISRLSTMGSAGFLLIFAAVNAANARLADKTGSLRWLAWCGAGLCLVALACLVGQTWSTNPQNLLILVAMLGLAFAIEAGYRFFRGREIRLRP